MENLFSEEIFDKILSIKSIPERAKAEQNLFETAKKQKQGKAVKDAYFEYKKSKSNQAKQLTFDDGMSLNVPGYSINQFNQIVDFNNNLVTATQIYPVDLYVNLQTNEETVKCNYLVRGKWQQNNWSKELLLHSGKITELSKKGIDVTNESAKFLVNYFRQVFNNNDYQRKLLTQKFGWQDDQFIPYDNDIEFDGEDMFKSFAKSYHTSGSYEIWLKEMYKVRKFNKIVRIAMGTSFAAPLLKILERDSFITVIWGQSGCGKSALSRVTQSIWGRNVIGEDIATCKNTAYVMAQFADLYNNLPVIYDELQLYEGNLNDLIMSLCENIEKGRGAASGGIRRMCTWRTSFTITGEESAVRIDTSGGALNRLIEIYSPGKIIEDGVETCEVISKNYGFAGREYINYIKTINKEQLKERFKENLDKIKSLQKTEEKQAISMALILLGEQLSCECIFKEDKPLDIYDIEPYLRDKDEIDNTIHAYNFFLAQLGSNQSKFANLEKRKDGDVGRPEHWGYIDKSDNKVYVITSKLENLLDNRFNKDKCLNKWYERGLVKKNKSGKFGVQMRSNGVISYYYIISIPEKDDEELEVDEFNKKNNLEKKQNEDSKEKQFTVDVVNSYTGENYEIEDIFKEVK